MFYGLRMVKMIFFFGPYKGRVMKWAPPGNALAFPSPTVAFVAAVGAAPLRGVSFSLGSFSPEGT